MVRPDILNVKAGIARGGLEGIVPSRPLCRLLRGQVTRCSVHHFAAHVGLWLGGVVDNDDLAGEAISVKGVPVRLPGASAFPRGLVAETGGSRHCRQMARRWGWHMLIAVVVGKAAEKAMRRGARRARRLGLKPRERCHGIRRGQGCVADGLVEGQKTGCGGGGSGGGRRRRRRGRGRRQDKARQRTVAGGGAAATMLVLGRGLVRVSGRVMIVRVIARQRSDGRRGRRHARCVTWPDPLLQRGGGLLVEFG